MADLGVTGGETRDDPPPPDAVGVVVRVVGPLGPITGVVQVIPAATPAANRTRSTVVPGAASQVALVASARVRFILSNPATSQQICYFNMDGSPAIVGDIALFPGGLYIDETGWQGAVNVIWPSATGALALVVDEDV